ncbi:response regulator [Methylobrevis pamukkalensis]|uniref:Transcriptional regulatory protein BaeR n=1 Tax=Methylobrevis pamukkalensis TaxID=1439726 RepID=A0A1E3H6H1_9HYPH|nr:response regulator [Methylobrevis pamukkalensis]ODN71927.1 Transcriptional regulatory protein BaeR [Methylobrevis pamukkalensis]
MMPTDHQLDSVCRILIVEDDPDDVFLLESAFSRVTAAAGTRLRVQTVGNGLEAINFVTMHDVVNDLPDIIVLDLNMPVIDGIGFLRSLRRSFDFEAIRVIVLTTSADHQIHATAREAGADEIFTKPDTREELVAIARRIIGRCPVCVRAAPAAGHAEDGLGSYGMPRGEIGHPPLPAYAGTASFADGKASSGVIELVPLTLREGVGEADFLSAAEAAADLLKSCPGFVRRRLARGAADEWVDFVEWERPEPASEAARTARQEDCMRAYLETIGGVSSAGRRLKVQTGVH